MVIRAGAGKMKDTTTIRGQQSGKTEERKRKLLFNGRSAGQFSVASKSFIYVDSLLVMYLSVKPPRCVCV